MEANKVQEIKNVAVNTALDAITRQDAEAGPLIRTARLICVWQPDLDGDDISSVVHRT